MGGYEYLENRETEGDHLASIPNRHVSLLTNSGNDGGKGRSGRENASVVLLDGLILRCHVRKSICTGLDLMQQVAYYLHLHEKEIFGLTYLDRRGFHRWLRLDTKVKLQTKKFRFYFRCKFYPLDPENDVRQDITRYLLCCQIRQDILTGKFPCSFESFALLGAYSLQADCGDAKELLKAVEVHGASSLCEFLMNYPIAPSDQQSVELIDRLCEIHKQLDGVKQNEADLAFLQHASAMSMYGMQFYEVTDNDNKPVTLGVNQTGVAVYKSFLRLKIFTWPRITRLKYRGNCLTLHVRLLDENCEPSEESVHNFTFWPTNAAKYCWQNVVDNHWFFKLERPDCTLVKKQNSLLRRVFSDRKKPGRYVGPTQAQLRTREVNSADRKHSVKRSSSILVGNSPQSKFS